METHVYINDREACSKAADGKSTAAFPDPCWSPPGPNAGPVVIPYTNTAFAKDLSNGTSTVFIKNYMVAQEDKSFYATSTGNEAATESFSKGVKTGKIKGKAYFKSWSMNVQFEGYGVPRHLDVMTHNHGSTPGNTAIGVNTGGKSPKYLFIEGFIVLKSATSTPYKKIKYRIKLENGVFKYGTTDKNGFTEIVSSEKKEKLAIEVEDFSKKNEWIEIGNSTTHEVPIKTRKEVKIICNHNDGALKIARYIVEQIKINTKSKYADDMRYYNDFEGRLKSWLNLPWWQQLIIPMPETENIAALSVWTERVAQGRPWDHKPIIRDKFKNEAVKRPLDSEIMSESHYHKYQKHDYFLDIWSNIHYGYVGMSCGFGESMLLDGAGLEQMGTDILTKSQLPNKTGSSGSLRDYDDIPDRQTITLGITLHKQFGKFANSLTPEILMIAVEKAQ